MNRLVEVGIPTAGEGLGFVLLDLNTIRVVVLSNASFGNAEGYKSQLGFVLCIVDYANNANIVHFGSLKCERVRRSVMAAELHSLVFGFDSAFIFRQTILEISGREVPIDAFIDSLSVFEAMATLGKTLKKRLNLTQRRCKSLISKASYVRYTGYRHLKTVLTLRRNHLIRRTAP
jgi:hypothetical protein